MTLRAVVRGVGHYLPERIVPNAEFEASLDTSDEWIRSRSGIERRHFAAEGEMTSHLATKAAEAALASAGIAAAELDALILATSTADFTFPAAATMVQRNIGMTGGFAYVLDLENNFVDKYNHELVEIHRIHTEQMEAYKNHLRSVIIEFVRETGSAWGREILEDFDGYISKFWLVKPKAADLQQLLNNTRARPE